MNAVSQTKHGERIKQTGMNTGEKEKHRTGGYDNPGEQNHNLSINKTILQNKRLREPNKIITGHVPLQGGAPGGTSHQTKKIESEKPIGIMDGRALPQPRLDEGQGKSTMLDMEISESSGDESGPPAMMHNDGNNNNRWPHRLLLPPVIESTGLIVTGATTEALRKQNKQQRNKALLRQPMESQWTIHQVFNSVPNNVWSHQQHKDIKSQMAPQRLALQHEAAGLLSEWESFGCPTNTGRDWTLDKIQAAIDRGPHQSALEPAAIEHFAEEVCDKVEKGQARVVLWDEIKGSHP